MQGILIDCYRKKDSIILWIQQGKHHLRLEDSFTPSFYVRADNLKLLQKKLLAERIKTRWVKKHTFYRRDVFALEIKVKKISFFHKMVRLVERITNYEAEIATADLKLEEYYLFSKDLFPLAKIEFKEKEGKIISIKAIDDANTLHYNLPDFTICRLKVKTKDNLFKGFQTKLEAVQCNKDVFTGEEKDILAKTKEAIATLNPDVFFTEHGNLFLPYLKEKARQYGIDLNFNRFEKDDFSFKQGEHYHSYGSVVFRTASIFLKGRLHIDLRSLFADDSGFYGILDVARISRQRVQRVAMRSAGAAVTHCLLHEAYKQDYLLPYKVGIYERFKTLKNLYDVDRGSIIYEPRIGFHADVAEFDYVSLYPNIMNKFNLSPETLFCSCCKDNKVPGLHYHYCRKRRGIVPIVAEKLISRRQALKKENTAEGKEKADYLKWLLVTMFGYQAFKNKKIGTIENHESIQAYARETLLLAAKTAELHDFEVLHGIIDSVYVKKKHMTEKEAARLCKDIHHATGLELKHEGNYSWIVFLPSVIEKEQPVPSRFYGVFADGSLKLRGIEARRRDTPKIIAAMQTEMIAVLAEAKTEEQFTALFPKIFTMLRNYVKSLAYAKADDLRITKRISKLHYKQEIAQKIVIEQMLEDNYPVQPGQTMAYIIKDMKSRYAKRRYVTLERFNGFFDKEKYTEMMVKAVFTLLQPFDVTKAMLWQEAGQERQLELNLFMHTIEIEVG